MKKVMSFVVPEWSIGYLVYNDETGIEETKLEFLKSFVERNSLQDAVWDWEDAEIRDGNWNAVTGIGKDSVMVVNALIAA